MICKMHDIPSTYLPMVRYVDNVSIVINKIMGLPVSCLAQPEMMQIYCLEIFLYIKQDNWPPFQ